MKAWRLLLAALALVSAGLQYNDPDPFYWVVAYAGTAIVLAGRAFGRFSLLSAAVVSGIVIGGMLMTFAGFLAYLRSGAFASIFQEMYLSPLYVEETREFIGLSLCLAALIWVCRRAS